MTRPNLVDRHLNGLSEELAHVVFNESLATEKLLNGLERSVGLLERTPSKKQFVSEGTKPSLTGKLNLDIPAVAFLILGALGMYFLYKLKEIEKKTPPKSNWFDTFFIQPYNESSVQDTFSYF
jgi:hypothetical protein